MNLLYDVIERFYLNTINKAPMYHNGAKLRNAARLTHARTQWLMKFINATTLRIRTQLENDERFFTLETPQVYSWIIMADMGEKEEPTLTHLMQYLLAIYPGRTLFFIRGNGETYESYN